MLFAHSEKPGVPVRRSGERQLLLISHCFGLRALQLPLSLSLPLPAAAYTSAAAAAAAAAYAAVTTSNCSLTFVHVQSLRR